MGNLIKKWRYVIMSKKIQQDNLRHNNSIAIRLCWSPMKEDNCSTSGLSWSCKDRISFFENLTWQKKKKKNGSNVAAEKFTSFPYKPSKLPRFYVWAIFLSLVFHPLELENKQITQWECIQHVSNTLQRTGRIHQCLPQKPRWKKQMGIQSGLIDAVNK